MHFTRSVVELRPALRVARGIAVCVAFCVTAALAAETIATNAAKAEPASSTTASRSFKPRAALEKIDPVEAIIRPYMPRDFQPDPHTLPGTFVVKFRDEVKARGTLKPSREIGSLNGRDMSEVRSLIAFYGGTMRQWIRKSEGELAQLEARARELSGNEQPDLAGMIMVNGIATHRFFEASKAFSALDMVEFVSIDLNPGNLQQGCDPTNAVDCNTPNCGIPGNCNPGQPDPEFGCNDVTCCNLVAGIDPSCNDEQDPTGWDVYCAALANQVCNPQVYSLGTYDACFYAPGAPLDINPIFFDVYFQMIQASCTDPHSGRGCSNPPCCAAVCTIDPACCSSQWDTTCADMVRSGSVPECSGLLGTAPTTDVSPDLTAQETGLGLQGFQFYTQSQRRAETLVPVIPGTNQTWPSQLGQVGSPDATVFGFSGQGLALKEMNDFQNLIWEYYQSGDPAANPYLNGNGIRIGAIESSAYVQHEDFILAGPPKVPTQPWEGPLLGQSKVISEPNQTPVFTEDGRISANHGTNVLGVMIAADNGFGITGVAHQAQGYFFPSNSMEDGFRGQDAIASCLQEFDQGDVMNFSWGFQDVVGLPYFNATFTDIDSPNDPPIGPTQMVIQPVTSQITYATLIALGTDLGVTSVVANGQGPRPIVSSIGDSGAIIVSAMYPGNILPGTTAQGRGSAPGYSVCETASEDFINVLRYPGSNFDGEDTGGSADASNDISGWGYGVATTGCTTERRNVIMPNPSFFLFRGLNDAPPAGTAPPLQVDQLRSYTDRFGGTSAAAAMISGLVARIQGASKQFYGMPITPRQVRTLLQTAPGSFLQCARIGNGEPTYTASDGPFFSQGLLADGTGDSCVQSGNGCIPTGCTCEAHPIGTFPNLTQLTPSILSIPDFDGNSTDVDVITGGQLVGYAWSVFQIRALDENYLRMTTQRMNAGTSREGLAYLASGHTTDVRVRKEVRLPDPNESVNSLGIRLVSRATRNFVMAGVFVKNWRRGRYEYFGAQFLTTNAATYTFPLPALGDYSPYINEQTNEVEMRVWTVGLGNTGRHVVDHDLIDIVVNQPLNPVP